MTGDVCITGTGKGVEHTTVTQINTGVTHNRALETTTIDKLCL